MRFTWRAGLAFLILWALAVGHLAAGVPRHDPADKNDRPDKKEKPLLIVAVLIGLLEPSCEPGRPVAFLKVRVTNKSRVSTPALPASEGIEAEDHSRPPWRGTAALPALRPGQVIEVAIPLEPTPNLLPGKHEFQVTINPRHVIEQEHYKFNTAGPLVVDIPAGFCRTTRIASGAEKLPPTNPQAGRSPNVSARPQQPEPPRNEPRPNDSGAQSATSKATTVNSQQLPPSTNVESARGAQLGARAATDGKSVESPQELSAKSLVRFGTLTQSPAPTSLGSPFTPFQCQNHLPPSVCQTSGLMFCQGGNYLDCPTPPWGAWTDPSQHLILIWYWDPKQTMDGFHLYRVDMDRHDLLMTVGFGNNGTVFDCGQSNGCNQMCFAVTAYKGKLESTPSSPFCAPNGVLQKGLHQRRSP